MGKGSLRLILLELRLRNRWLRLICRWLSLGSRVSRSLICWSRCLLGRSLQFRRGRLIGWRGNLWLALGRKRRVYRSGRRKGGLDRVPAIRARTRDTC